MSDAHPLQRAYIKAVNQLRFASPKQHLADAVLARCASSSNRHLQLLAAQTLAGCGYEQHSQHALPPEAAQEQRGQGQPAQPLRKQWGWLPGGSTLAEAVTGALAQSKVASSSIQPTLEHAVQQVLDWAMAQGPPGSITCLLDYLWFHAKRKDTMPQQPLLSEVAGRAQAQPGSGGAADGGVSAARQREALVAAATELQGLGAAHLMVPMMAIDRLRGQLCALLLHHLAPVPPLLQLLSLAAAQDPGEPCCCCCCCSCCCCRPAGA
jgi:hypothetical protein